MIKRAYHSGVEAASKRFGVREGSIMGMIQDTLPLLAMGAAKSTAKALVPGAFAHIDRLQEAPGKFLRRNLLPAHMQVSPADALARHLETASLPPTGPHMMGIR
jgi:hypothetical protein